jgi:hypothetical protein
MAVSSTKKHNKINGLLFCRFPSSTFAIDTSHWVNAVAERGFQGRKTKIEQGTLWIGYITLLAPSIYAIDICNWPSKPT